MKLFLASQAKHPQSITDLDHFVGGFENKHIGYIPTAANAEEGYGVWKNGGSWKKVNELGATVTPLVLEEFRSDAVISEMEKQDILWFGGGYWTYLMYWIKFCKIDLHILDLLNSGIIYVGSSAGMNMTGPTLQMADWFEGEGEPVKNVFSGLGLVEFDVYPHYRDEQYDFVKAHYSGPKMYLLKDGESITVDGDTITILGEERIITPKQN
ncbi:Type 1 glutamine amidotransferase-like domain-containing protein [candidate division WWE3 bacterium]|uniref:Type 1 glutamine amidotransferase-like domain-containing protein n=1 Tax=candidate division WWE3 bacterium TaxID=2053526 RepID=A0A955RQ77_UNCKA|nr:Type 1 glutamine amidotransferase-like domain-containing protein [candidate division WWE3 bacterium]